MVGYRVFFIVRWQLFCRIGILFLFCMIASMSIMALFPLPAFALSAGVTVSQTASTVTINASADLQSCELNYAANQQIGWQPVGGYLGSCRVRGVATAGARNIWKYPTIDSIIPTLYSGNGTTPTTTITPVTYADGACYVVGINLQYSVAWITVRKVFPNCTTVGIMDVYLDGRWVGGVFYGSNKVTKQISLPRSSLTLGTHVAKVIVRSGLGISFGSRFSPAPVNATASFTTTCGLTVTIIPAKTSIEPNITWCKDPKNPKCRRFQPLSKRSTSVDINITDSVGTAVDGANIVLTVERASTKFGGHDHDATIVAASTRPLGSLTQAIGKGQGLYTSTYTATQLAAQDNIRVKASFQGCSGEAVSKTITSAVSWLSKLVVPPPHEAIGGTNKHFGPSRKQGITTSPDNNHWVTLRTNDTMSYLMLLYSLEYGTGIYVNDASLPFGGKFDVNGRWVERDHKTHRRGIDIDIRLYDKANTAANETVIAHLQALERVHPELLAPFISYKIHSEKTANRHLHIYFW